MNIFQLLVKGYRYLKKSKFIKEFNFFDRSSGIEGNCIFIGKENMRIGANVYLGTGCELIAYNSHFDCPLNSRLVIGDNVRMTARCRITCAGNIKIDNNVLIAPDVMITDHNHGTDPMMGGVFFAASFY